MKVIKYHFYKNAVLGLSLLIDGLVKVLVFFVRKYSVLRGEK